MRYADFPPRDASGQVHLDEKASSFQRESRLALQSASDPTATWANTAIALIGVRGGGMVARIWWPFGAGRRRAVLGRRSLTWDQATPRLSARAAHLQRAIAVGRERVHLVPHRADREMKRGALHD